MAAQLLLLKDVEALGRSGDIVNVKPGYARNYLLPQGLAIIADNRALRMQESLKEERRKRALVDKQESEEIATRIDGLSLTKVVKVDQEGHMYGSVTLADVAELLKNEAHVEIEKKSIQIKHAIKTTGVHAILIKLKEGVTATINLKVMSEEGHRAATQESAQEAS